MFGASPVAVAVREPAAVSVSAAGNERSVPSNSSSVLTWKTPWTLVAPWPSPVTAAENDAPVPEMFDTTGCSTSGASGSTNGIVTTSGETAP